MKKMVVVSVMLIVAVFFAGCVATAGRQFDRTHVNDIKKGVQDKTDILAWFGEPFSKGELKESSKCVERWIYSYVHVVGYPIPFATEAVVTDSYRLLVDFDAKGNVCNTGYYEQKEPSKQRF